MTFYPALIVKLIHMQMTVAYHIQINLLSVSKYLTENGDKDSKWMEGNRLKLNADKTHLLTVGTSNRVNRLMQPVSVVIDDMHIKQSPHKSERLLGIQMDYDWKWRSILHDLQSKLKHRLAGLLKLRGLVPIKDLKLILIRGLW